MRENTLPSTDLHTPARFAKFAKAISIITPIIQSFVAGAFMWFFTFQKHRMPGLLVMSVAISLLIALKVTSRALAAPLGERYPRRQLFAAIAPDILYCGFFLLMLAFAPTIKGWLTADLDLKRSKERFETATRELAAAKNQDERFYALGRAAKESFNSGKIEDARQYAKELLELAPQYQSNWNYGNALQNGNLVLGRIAVREGHLEEAKQYLLIAGSSHGSPGMDTFGPNMSLAKDLLEKGERDVVLQYFVLCRKFWELEDGKLKEWSDDVKAGYIPDFGANLVY